MSRNFLNGTLPGAYCPGHSLLHRLDAGSKLICFLLLLAGTILTHTPTGFLFLGTGLAILFLVSRIPLRQAFSSLPGMWSFLLVVFLMNALFTRGENILWSGSFLCVSLEGIKQGSTVILRILILILLSNLLLSSTPPMEITSALTGLMRPLALLHLPAGEIALILSTAIRFIPTLSEEAEKLRLAQTARGARFDSRHLSERAADYLALLLPIFLAAFRRADELSLAMEARGYRSGHACLPPRSGHTTRPDLLAILACTAFFAVLLLLS